MINIIESWIQEVREKAQYHQEQFEEFDGVEDMHAMEEFNAIEEFLLGKLEELS